MPVDPSMSVTGAEWQVPGLSPSETIAQPGGAQPAEEAGFGGALGPQIGRLDGLQDRAGEASRSLAAGTATDPASVVMEIECARLATQLASQIRTKAVESIQDVFHTQV